MVSPVVDGAETGLYNAFRFAGVRLYSCAKADGKKVKRGRRGKPDRGLGKSAGGNFRGVPVGRAARGADHFHSIESAGAHGFAACGDREPADFPSMAAGHAFCFSAGRSAVGSRCEIFDLAGAVFRSCWSIERGAGAAGGGVSSEMARGIAELE